MNKDKFNELDPIKQVEYINSQLKNNKSITSVVKEIGIARSTIKNRFEKIKYFYNEEAHQYLLNNKSVTDVVQANEIQSGQANNNDSATDVVQDNDKVNNRRVTTVTDKAINAVVTLNDDAIKNNLLLLAQDYDVIKELIELHRRNTSVIKQQIIIDIEDPESQLSTQRFNKKILNEFNEFCNDNKQFKKVDLISMALKEYMEKYR